MGSTDSRWHDALSAAMVLALEAKERGEFFPLQCQHQITGWDEMIETLLAIRDQLDDRRQQR